MSRLLLVVDMQHDFIDGSLGSEQARQIVGKVAEKIDTYRANGDAVMFTRDTHGADYPNTQEGRRLPVAHCVQGTAGWEISDALDTTGAVIWDKSTFGSPELAAYIRDAAPYEAIELVGLCTDICVVSNALLLKAFLPEATVSVDARCCAGVTEESHRAALLTMRMCQVAVTGA